MGYEKVQCVVAHIENEHMVKALNIALNKITSVWNEQESYRIKGNRHTVELYLFFNELLDEQKQEFDSTLYDVNLDYVLPIATTERGTSGENTTRGDVADSCMENFDGTVSLCGANGFVNRATVAAADYSLFAVQAYNNNVKECD